MEKEVKHEEAGVLSSEIQDVMKYLITAIRIVKIYPANNPIYSQSITKAFAALSNFLKRLSEYRLGVQKTYFLYADTPVGKEADLNRSIAQDLFAKGVREIVFSAGIAEQELLELCTGLALSSEELDMRSGISTILWETGANHIKVTEAGLDDIIAEGSGKTNGGDLTGKKSAELSGRTLVLGDVKTDPEGFAAGMLEYAQRTRSEGETVEDRLLTLYGQAGKKIEKDHSQEQELLFSGLAKSVLALASPHRETFINGKLYPQLDADMTSESKGDDHMLSLVHEVSTGRFSNDWSVEQVTALLKHSSARPSPPPAVNPSELQAAPLSPEIEDIAKSLLEVSSEESVALELVSTAGMESGITEAAVRTLTALISLVKTPFREESSEKSVEFFSGVVKQLEGISKHLIQNKNYELARTIIVALHTPVHPAFQPRMAEALQKTGSGPVIKAIIMDMRKHVTSSPEYQAAYSLLSSLDQKATETLLDLLVEEADRDQRMFLLNLLKDLGKNQLALLGEHLTDARWYVVRNIVSILAENKTEQALGLLRKAAEHKNIQIRQEVAKALLAIGGKKAALVLTRFFRDQDPDMQMMALRGMAEMSGIGAEEARPLMEFLNDHHLNRKDHPLTLAAIRTLGKIGGDESVLFLTSFTRVRWWKPRKIQVERRDAALRAIDEIKRRRYAGRTRR